MALPRPPLNPAQSIPNNPFFSPQTNYIQGSVGPLIVGTGLSINYATGTILSSGGGGGGGAVDQVIGGNGIAITPVSGTGTVTVSNLGVTSVNAGPGVVVSGSTGNITISVLSAPGTVTNVTGVAPIGVITGTSTPVISIAAASTTASGATQLINNLTTNDATKSLTAAQGYALQQQLSALTIASNLTLAGTFNAATSQVLTVTSAGSAAVPPFVVGSNLPAPAAGNTDYFVIVTTPGTYDPPGASGPFSLSQGDWLLSNGTIWQLLAVGFQAPASSPTTAGVVRLATTAETQTGTNAAIAVTPAGACQTYIPRSCVTAKGTLIAGQAATTPAALPIGVTGQILMVDPFCTTGMKWANVPVTGGTVTFVGSGNALTGGPITASGSLDLKTQALAPGTYTNASVAVNNYGIVTAISSGPTAIPISCVIGKGSLITGTGPNSPTALAAGIDGYVLSSCSASPNGLCWTPGGGGGGAASGIPCSCIVAKGTMIAGSGTNLPGSLTIGADNLFLRACSACALGVTWAAGCPGTVTNVVGTTPISVATGTTIPIVSIATATTTSPGATQLIDNTTSNDSTKALTAAQGYSLQQQISALNVASNLTLAGTLDASTGLLLSTTNDGLLAGFFSGAALPSAVAGNTDYFVIATVGGTYDPPGPGGPYTVTQGDWFVSNGTQWNYFDVGPAIPTGTSGSPGIVQLATSAQTIAGTDSTVAVTPASGAAAYVPLDKLTGQGALAVGVATSTAGTLAVGAASQVLTVDLACTNGLKWATPSGGTVTSVTAGAGLAGGTITTTGSIALSTSGVTAGAYTYPSITVDTYGRIISAADGSTPVLCSTATTKGDLLAASAPSTVTRLGVGTDGQILVACSASATGLAWIAPATASAAIPCASLTSKGALITASVPGTPTALPVGTDGQVLIADSTCSAGLRWCTSTAGGGTVTSVTAGSGLAGGTITSSGTVCIPASGVTAGAYTNASVTVNALGIVTNASSGVAAIPCSIVTTKGDILAASGPSSVCRVASGANGQVLSVNSACIAGVEWITVTQNAIPCSCIINKGALVTGSGVATPSALPVGTDGQILVACSAASNGLCWTSAAAAAAAIPCSTLTAKGALVTATSPNTPTALAVGTDGQILSACAACTSGLTWVANPGGTVTSVSGTAPIAVSTGTTTPVISVATATTAVTGVTTLVDNTSTNDNTKALTAAQGYALQQQIDSLATSSNIILAGTLNAATGLLATVTSQGILAGFAAGSSLPGPDVTNDGYYVIVTTGGSYTPPLDTLVYNATQGDWFLSNGTGWEYLNVGFDPQNSSTTVSGIVRLATTAETQTGTSNTIAVTPQGAAATYVPRAAYAAKGTILGASAANTPSALAVGTNGQVLLADSACTSGLKWGNVSASLTPATPTVAGVVKGCVSSTCNNVGLGCFAVQSLTSGNGNIGIGTCALASNTTGANNIAVGVNAISNATVSAGNIAIGGGTLTATTVGADNVVIGLSAANGNTGSFNVAIGSCALCATSTGARNTAVGYRAGAQLLTGCNNVAIGFCAAVPSSSGSCQLAIGFSFTDNWLTGDSTKAIKPGAGILDCGNSTGTNGQVLASNGSNALCWQTLTPSIPCACITAKGVILSGTAAGVVSPLLVGGDGQYLVACSTAANGLCWMTSPDVACAAYTAKGVILAASGAGTPTALAVGINGQVLTANSACTNGVTWTTACSGTVTCIATGTGISGGPITSSGTIAIANTTVTTGSYTNACFTVNAQGQLTAAGSGPDPILCSTVTTLGDLVVGAGPASVSRLGVGLNGQVLVACGICPTGLAWVNAGTAFGAATPTVEGSLKGCTDNIFRGTALGCQALVSNSATDNTAVGFQAGCCSQLGSSNTYIGAYAGVGNCTGCNNISIGVCSSTCALTSCNNIALGNCTMTNLVAGNCNIAIGSCALCTQQLGCRNTAIGHCVQVPNVNAGCQLAIGFDNNCYWLTGCADKSIRPGAGIVDCAGCTGGSGQTLVSTGSNAVVWASPAPVIYSARLCAGYAWTSNSNPIPYWTPSMCTCGGAGFAIQNALGHQLSAMLMPLNRVIRLDFSASIATCCGTSPDGAGGRVAVYLVNGSSGNVCNTVGRMLTSPIYTNAYSCQQVATHGFICTSTNNCLFAWLADGGRRITFTNYGMFTATIIC
jgi:hypothetical protein